MMEDYLAKAVEIAREAGALVADEFKRPKKISYKRPSDLVTEADRRSEALIIERLRKHYPTHAIVGLGLLLVRGSARWHDELRARVRGVLRDLGIGSSGRGHCGRGL